MRKKKQLVLLIVFGSLILALTGATVGLSMYQKNQDAKESERASREAEENQERLKIFDRNEEDIVRISYTNPSGNRNDYYYDDEKEAWVAEEDPEYPLAQVNLVGIASLCANMKAAKIAADTVDDPALYGLDHPDYTLTATDRDGNTTVVKVGLKNDYYNNYYLTVDGRDTLYLVGETVPDHLRKNLSDMLGMKRLEIPGQEEIRTLSVEDHYKLVYLPGGSTEYSYYPTEIYFLDHGKDGMTPADATISEEVMRDAAKLSSYECVAYRPSEEDLERMSLTEDKAFRVTYSYVETPVEGGKADPEAEKNPKEVVILIGDAIREESEDGKEGTVVGFYAKPENGDAVYRLDSEPVNALFLKHEADFFTTLYSKVLQSNVETLDVMMGGEKKISYRFDRHPGKDDDGKDITVTDFYMNDTAVDSGYVNGVYYKFGRLAYDRVLTEKDKIPEKYEPDLEMIYHTNLEHFEEITVGYMKYDSNYDIVYLNGEPKALINFREVEGLEKDLDEALQTLEKLRESAADTTEGV